MRGRAPPSHGQAVAAGRLEPDARCSLAHVRLHPGNLHRVCRDLSVCVIRDADAAWLSDTFEPRSNVHAIPEYVTILDDNVADMNADAEFDALVLRYSCITLHHAALDLNRTACSVHGTCKLNQYAIAGPLDDTAAMICNLWL